MKFDMRQVLPTWPPAPIFSTQPHLLPDNMRLFTCYACKAVHNVQWAATYLGFLSLPA